MVTHCFDINQKEMFMLYTLECNSQGLVELHIYSSCLLQLVFKVMFALINCRLSLNMNIHSNIIQYIIDPYMIALIITTNLIGLIFFIITQFLFSFICVSTCIQTNGLHFEIHSIEKKKKIFGL